MSSAAMSAPVAATAVATHIASAKAWTNADGSRVPAGARAWKTAPMTATPSEPPIIRFIERIPDATPALDSVTAFIAAVDIGDMTRAMPKPMRTNDGQMLAYVVCTSTVVSQ